MDSRDTALINTIKISLCLSGHPTIDVPEIHIIHNGDLLKTAVVNQTNQWIDFDLELVEENTLSIDFHNKLPEHTIVEDEKIFRDMWVELHKIRIDDILLQSWMLHDGEYRPRYFESYIKDFPDSPTALPSQLIWHFPGTFQLAPFPSDFWAWYHYERSNRIKLDNMDKDLHRWEKFVGSIERYPEIVAKIKEIIRA